MNKFSFERTITIDGRVIGPNEPPYIVAELSANHNGSLDKAIESIKVAKECGADAVKLQTYNADTMTIQSDKDYFKIKGGLWDGYSLYKLYHEAQTPFEWHKPLFEYAKKIGITLFSTPFDETAVDLLESLDVPAFKIASFEVTDLPLIRRVAETGKPLIISTGMADLAEIEDAIETVVSTGNKELILLHCISAYPAPIEQCNLRTIVDLSQRFGALVGLSDHTLDNAAAITSVALGACFIEKHFTLNRNDPGPDSAFSIEPCELNKLCSDSKKAWQALGRAGYEQKPAEEKNLVFRRSLFFVKDMKKGDVVTPINVRRIRPGHGLLPKYYEDIMGKTVNQDIEKGTPVQWSFMNLK